MSSYSNRPTPPFRPDYARPPAPRRPGAPPQRRRGCSGAALLILLVLALLLGVLAWLDWPGLRQQTGSAGGGSGSLSRPTVMPAATPTVGLAPVRTATPTSVQPALLSPFTTSDVEPDWAGLQRLMLEAINQDRAAERLLPVAWDQLAADVGAAHGREMVTADYFSHWDLAGLGPDLRYAQAGGIETVNENLHLYWLRYDDGSGAPIEDWEAVVLAGQKGLMESPGHRANILDPAHTHVGIGMAYDQASGTLAIAQEFINRYVTLDNPPQSAERGRRYLITGSVASGVSDPVLNIRYLPPPASLTVAQVGQKPNVYQSESTFFDYGVATLDGAALELSFGLPDDAPAGIYLVCLWVVLEGLPDQEPQVITLALPLPE